jgi:hypothetical protein
MNFRNYFYVEYDSIFGDRKRGHSLKRAILHRPGKRNTSLCTVGDDVDIASLFYGKSERGNHHGARIWIWLRTNHTNWEYLTNEIIDNAYRVLSNSID